MLHQHLPHRFALEGNSPREHLVEDDPKSVDVNFLAVAPIGHFGRHVVNGSDTLRLAASAAARDELGRVRNRQSSPHPDR